MDWLMMMDEAVFQTTQVTSDFDSSDSDESDMELM
jgi:hypothetical protein